MRIKVKITEEHIRSGKPRTITLCPIALALKDKFPYSSVRVGADDVSIDDSEYNLSKEARRFVDRFDHEKPVAPATFILTEHKNV